LTDKITITAAPRPENEHSVPLPTYHELLDQLCLAFGVPGSPSFGEAVLWAKAKLDCSLAREESTRAELVKETQKTLGLRGTLAVKQVKIREIIRALDEMADFLGYLEEQLPPLRPAETQGPTTHVIGSEASDAPITAWESAIAADAMSDAPYRARVELALEHCDTKEEIISYLDVCYHQGHEQHDAWGSCRRCGMALPESRVGRIVAALREKEATED